MPDERKDNTTPELPELEDDDRMLRRLADEMDLDYEDLREQLQDSGLADILKGVTERQDEAAQNLIIAEITGRFSGATVVPDPDDQGPLMDRGNMRISAADKVVGLHEKKVIDGTTVAGTSIAGFWTTTQVGADERRAVAILVSEIAAETGISLAAEGCYNITGDDTRNPGGVVDWRGRLLRIVVSHAATDEASADDLDEWTDYEVDRFRCGADANGGNVGGRANSISIQSFGAGGGIVYLLLDGLNGRFVVMTIGVSELQFHIRIDAGDQFDADSNDDVDGL